MELLVADANLRKMAEEVVVHQDRNDKECSEVTLYSMVLQSWKVPEIRTDAQRD